MRKNLWMLTAFGVCVEMTMLTGCSIDDNEVADLVLLCNQIFGDDNLITVAPRVIKKGGKSTYKSSCTEYRPILTQNLKGKTTIYQHARGIGMTNGRRNSNSIYYTSDIKKFEPILIKKEKEKVEHIENFRSSKYRNINSNTIDICDRNGNNKKIIGKEKIINVNDENIENNNGNIIA